MPEREKKEQEIEKLFEQTMKENFPNLVKEIDFQEAQRAPKKLDPRRNTPRHIIIKDKKRMMKQECKKMRRGLGTSGTTLSVTTSE